MTLKDFSTFLFLLFGIQIILGQNALKGTVSDFETKEGIRDAELYDRNGGLLALTDEKGNYSFQTEKTEINLIVFAFGYKVKEQKITVAGNGTVTIQLESLGEQLTEVEVVARKAKVFSTSRLKDVEETAIYAGKKTEVVLVEQSMANLATNNARQIFGQIAGLNIYQNDDAGLQLNIGGRGLDPNRTANFNTRQNGYDISADVLGYPESYYSPASEGLKEIQIIRGAASLQYGTQFGGLVNFVMKSPNPNKPFELITRNTVGSYGLYTNFTSISGTKNKFSYYAFYNHKQGDGFRPNSEFDSNSVYTHLGYKFNKKTKLSGEITYMNYLAQQAGGLTNEMFEKDPFQSNRTRNWFEINWFLYNLKLSHKFSEKSNFTFNFFGLNATRNALGYRENRVDTEDLRDLATNEFAPRDLIKGDFNNFGFESRLVNQYELLNQKSTFLLGLKLYKAQNSDWQGPGSNKSDADFGTYQYEFPNYKNQSNHTYPNLNTALFGENILYLTKKFSITPGFRAEYIKTESEGVSRTVTTDFAGNVIGNITNNNDISRERSFFLYGLGLSYKGSTSFELYANASQNYRSVTFSDISIVNPNFEIDPNIKDENGYTFDLGVRGTWKKKISYDINCFYLNYKDRIGSYYTANNFGKPIIYRTNIGDSHMFGFESLVDFNLNEILLNGHNKSIFNYFINSSIIDSEYTKSNTKERDVVGNKVEFIPKFNIKSGIKIGYNDFLMSAQYTFLSNQFTDATNSTSSSGLDAIIGIIPTYDVLDLSASYRYKRFKLEVGVNNALDNIYFTRRATGYPGPGIIPSADRNYYTTLEIKI